MTAEKATPAHTPGHERELQREREAEAQRLDRDAEYDRYQSSQGNADHDPKFAAVIAERDALRAEVERLRAIAAYGLDAASVAYAALVAHPHDFWRVKNQAVYCALLDFIAKATGREAEDVQNEYEELAAIEKATK